MRTEPRVAEWWVPAGSSAEGSSRREFSSEIHGTARPGTSWSRPSSQHQAGLMAALALMLSCAPEVVIGAERELSITTASVLADGRVREAGTRDGEGWYGISTPAGVLPEFTAPGVLAIHASTTVSGLWVLAGTKALDDGRTTGWVRAVRDDLSEAWTVTFDGPAGISTEARTIVAASDGSVMVAGFENPSDGWVALLEPSGAVRWKRRFAVDFQQQARGVRPVSSAASAPPATPSRRQLWLGGTRGTVAYALQLTLDGDLWDSEPFGEGNSVVGIVSLELGLGICVAGPAGARISWTQGGGVSGGTLTSVNADLSVVGCLLSGERFDLYGTSQQRPAVATVDRSARQVPAVRVHPTQTDAVVRGAVLDLAGQPMVLGHTQSPLRRWRDVVP